MKTILFDLMATQMAIYGTKFSGGGEYIKTVFRELCKYKDQVRIITFFNQDQFMDDWVKDMIESKGIKNYKISDYSEILKLDILPEVDTYFAGLMYFFMDYKMPKHIRTIGVYHGFRNLEMTIKATTLLYESGIKSYIKNLVKLVLKKRYFAKKLNEQSKMINSCDIIVGVSEHSGYSAEMFFPDYDKNRIRVFYSPLKYVPVVEDIDSVETKKVVLMLGGNRWEKNVHMGIIAADELINNGQLEGYIVKVVGGIPKAIYKKIRNKDRFRAVGYLSPEDLERTYKECDFFLYPTLNEGFGYPPLEAMKYNKTCIISAVTSLPEIYKDSVYYCNPYDIKEIKMRMLQAVEIKIPAEYIKEHYNRIAARQICDLRKLCELILNR